MTVGGLGSIGVIEKLEFYWRLNTVSYKMFIMFVVEGITLWRCDAAQHSSNEITV